MMESLMIEATGETPAVRLNAREGTFSFEGKSYPENVNSFYGPVISYVESYLRQPGERTTLTFNWLYYNTATSKMIVRVIMLLKPLAALNHGLTINWLCKKDDDLLIEKGEELKEVLDLEFNIILS